MAGTGKRHTSNNLDVELLVASLVAGLVSFIISVLIYAVLKELMWTPLAVGLSFMIFAIIFIAIMVFVNMHNDNLGYHVAKHHDGGQIFLVLLGIIILTFGLGILFEFLYEIDFSSERKMYQEPTSYVFIIDNSGSMEGNDPEGLRYSAIKEIMAGKEENFPYAVYSFSNDVIQERALAPISAGNNDLQPQNLGGTMIKLALDTVYTDYETTLKDGLGVAPKFLILSDGHASDVGLFRPIKNTLKQYAKANIPISAVGLGGADEKLMRQIAETTGGVYVSADNVATLEEAMKQAMTEESEVEQRTLYTYRTVPNANALYALMRILFTAILGVLISCAMLFATGKGEDSEMILVSSVITGILAGVLLEVGINFFRIPQILMRAIYFMLVASTFVTLKAFGGSGSGRKYQDQLDAYDVRVTRKTMGKVSGIDTTFDDSFGGGIGNGGIGSNSGSGQFDDDFF